MNEIPSVVNAAKLEIEKLQIIRRVCMGFTLYVAVVYIDTDDHLERIQSHAIFHFESFSCLKFQ